MRRRLARAVLLAPCLALSACMNLSGLGGDTKYACKAPEGVACDSVSGTYANALQHNLPSQRALRASERAPSMRAPALPIVAAPAAAPDAPAPELLRSPPRLLRLWIKPWEDADGDLFDAGYVYVEVDRGRWLLEHVQRRSRDAYQPVKSPPGQETGRTVSPEASPVAGAARPSEPRRQP